MHSSSGLLIAAIGLFSLLACSGGEDGQPIPRREPGTEAPGPGGGGTSASTDSPAKQACAASASNAPKHVGTETNATDVHLTSAGVIYRSGGSVIQVGRDGTDKKTIHTSENGENVLRSWFDDTSIVLVESTPDTDAATLRVLAFEGGQPDPNGGITQPTELSAATIEIFASDTTSFYLKAESGADEVIYRVSKANPAEMAELVRVADVLTSPLVANGYLWYVRNGQRVYRAGGGQLVADPPDNGGDVTAPEEVFGLASANLRLAVDSKNVFYSTGNKVEKRDRDGNNAAVVLDIAKSKSTAAIGAIALDGSTLIVASSAPDPVVKHVIRSVKVGETSADETFLVCGRETAPTNLVIDKASIAWIEPGKGVFVAPR